MGLPTLYMPTFSETELTRIIVDAVVLGTLGCIDTLLSAMVADSLTREQHDSNKELIGQGIGNIVSGICGGLPGAGATMGTVVNIQTGAQTILAGVIRALILLVVVLFAAPLAAGVPLAVLSAIAFKVGLDILDWSFLKRAHKVSKTSMAIMYGVLLLTVFTDLILAVGIGVFIANLLTIQRLSKYHAKHIRSISDSHDAASLSERESYLMTVANGRVLLFHLSGPMIFGVAKAIAREHASMESVKALVIDLSDVPIMGTTVALSIENMALDARSDGAEVYVVGARGQSRKRLQALGMFEIEGLMEAESREEALSRAVANLTEESSSGNRVELVSGE
jgi:SulP family sulfate permease